MKDSFGETGDYQENARKEEHDRKNESKKALNKIFDEVDFQTEKNKLYD